jgi:ribosomal protein S8
MRMKRANPAKWICPYSKTISQINQSLKNLSFIADIQNMDNNSGNLPAENL